MKIVSKIFIAFAMLLTSAFASILDQPFITVDNDGLNISNEAAFISYISQIDANLTNSYKIAATPIDTRDNPYKASLDVKTYEDAFKELRMFYKHIYDTNSTDYMDDKIKHLTVEQNSALSALLAANRKHLSDSAIIILAIEYTAATNAITKLQTDKKFMLETAKELTKKILYKEYGFSKDESFYLSSINTLSHTLATQTDNVKKVILENNILVNRLNLDFMLAVKKMQTINAAHSWKDSAISFIDKGNISPYVTNIDAKNLLFNDYIKSVNDVNRTIQEQKLNQKIADEIAKYYKQPAYKLQFEEISKSFFSLLNELQDFTLFVFDNNNVQVIDMLDFMEVAIAVFIMQVIAIMLLRRVLRSESLNLAEFFLKIIVIAYLTYYFAISVLYISPSNLTTFASAFSLAFGFGMQNIIQNFIAGIVVMSEKTVKIGDSVTLSDGRSGIVTDVNYRTTTLKTEDNSVILVPNSKIFLDVLENKTKHDPKTRVKISFIAEKDIDFIALEGVLENVCKDIEGFVSTPAPELAIGSITKDSVMLEFRLYVASSKYADNQKITRNLYSALQAFTKKDANV